MSSTEDARDDRAEDGLTADDGFIEPPVHRSTYTPPSNPSASSVEPAAIDDDELANALAADLSTLTGSMPVIYSLDDPTGTAIPNDDPFAGLFGARKSAEPVVEAPPVAEQPAPAFEIPPYEVPPAPTAPVYEVPPYVEPVAPPVYEVPTFEAPVVDAPVFEAPAYEIPSYVPPPVYNEQPSAAPSTPVWEMPEASAPEEPPVGEEPYRAAPTWDQVPPAAPSAFEMPAAPAPAFDAQSFPPPPFDPPVYEAPTHEAPTYEAPSYVPPAYEPPSFSTPAAPSQLDEPTFTPSSFEQPAAFPPPPFPREQQIGEPFVMPSAAEQAASLANLSAPAGPPWIPQRRSMSDDQLMSALEIANGPEGTNGMMQELQDQLRMREEEAQEYRDWEQSMLDIGSPEALAAVDKVRPQFTGIVPPSAEEAPAPVVPEAFVPEPIVPEPLSPEPVAPVSAAAEPPVSGPVQNWQPSGFDAPSAWAAPVAEEPVAEEPVAEQSVADSFEAPAAFDTSAADAPADEEVVEPESNPFDFSETPTVPAQPAYDFFAQPEAEQPEAAQSESGAEEQQVTEPQPDAEAAGPNERAFDPFDFSAAPFEFDAAPSEPEAAESTPVGPDVAPEEPAQPAPWEQAPFEPPAFAPVEPEPTAWNIEPVQESEPASWSPEPVQETQSEPDDPFASLFATNEPTAEPVVEPIADPAPLPTWPPESVQEPAPEPVQETSPEPAQQAEPDPFASLFSTAQPEVAAPDANPWAEPAAFATAPVEGTPEPDPFMAPPFSPPTLVEPPAAPEPGLPEPWYMTPPPADSDAVQPTLQPEPPLETPEPTPEAVASFDAAISSDDSTPFTIDAPPAPSWHEPAQPEQQQEPLPAESSNDFSSATSAPQGESTTPSEDAPGAPLNFDDLLSGGDPAAPVAAEPRPLPDSAVGSAGAAKSSDEIPGFDGDEELDGIDESDRAFGDMFGPTVAAAAVISEPLAVEQPEPPAEQQTEIVVEAPPAAPKVFEVERSGPEPTPLDRRVGRAAGTFWLWFAANSSIVSVAFGAIILALGMSPRQAVVATAIGVVLSCIPLGLGVLAGKRSGQPTMIISRAAFGVHGNVIPALIALFARLFWGAALLWLLAASVAAILVGAEADAGLGQTTLTLIGVGVGLLLAGVIAYFGYALIAKLQLVVSILSGVLIVGLIVLTAPAIDLAAMRTVSDGSWLLLLTGGVLVFSFVGVVWANSSADLARYQNPASSGPAASVWASFGAAIPTILLISYGALLAASNDQFAAGLLANPLDTLGRLMPVWYPIPLILATALGLLSAVVVSIYSGAFALQSVGVRMSRPASTILVAVLLGAVAAVLSIMGLELTGLFRDVATTVAVPVAAWAGIFGADLLARKRRYDSASLLRTGGVYPSVHWVNLPALVVIIAIGFGLSAATVAGLSWQGYLFPLLGVPLDSVLATSDVGVFVALGLGLLVPLVAGIPGIRRQESMPGLPN